MEVLFSVLYSIVVFMRHDVLYRNVESSTLPFSIAGGGAGLSALSVHKFSTIQVQPPGTVQGA